MTVLNTMVQTFLGRLILNGVKMYSIVDDFKNTFTSQSSVFTTFSMSQLYYLQIGTLLIFVIAVEAFIPDLIAFTMTQIGRSKALRDAKKIPRTFTTIKNAILYYETDFAMQYAKLNYFLIFGIGFGSGLPIITFFATIYIVANHYMVKHMFSRASKIPTALGPDIFFTSVRASFFAIFCRLLFSVIAFSDPLVFPSAAQTNVVSTSTSKILPILGSTASARLDSIPIQTYLLLLWPLFLIVHCATFSILDYLSSRPISLMRSEQSLLSTRLEANEDTDNYLMHRAGKILSVTAPSYHVYKLADNQVVKAAFAINGDDVSVGSSGDTDFDGETEKASDNHARSGENKETFKSYKFNTVMPIVGETDRGITQTVWNNDEQPPIGTEDRLLYSTADSQKKEVGLLGRKPVDENKNTISKELKNMETELSNKNGPKSIKRESVNPQNNPTKVPVAEKNKPKGSDLPGYKPLSQMFGPNADVGIIGGGSPSSKTAVIEDAPERQTAAKATEGNQPLPRYMNLRVDKEDGDDDHELRERVNKQRDMFLMKRQRVLANKS